MWTQTSEAGRESREFGARPGPPVTGCGDLRGFERRHTDVAWVQGEPGSVGGAGPGGAGAGPAGVQQEGRGLEGRGPTGRKQAGAQEDLGWFLGSHSVKSCKKGRLRRARGRLCFWRSRSGTVRKRQELIPSLPFDMSRMRNY